MSTHKQQEDLEAEFRDLVRETFEPHTKSEQYFDHPDEERVTPDGPGTPPPARRHNDGRAIHRAFGLEPFGKFLERAGDRDHPVAQHPGALAHFLTHINERDRWLLGEDEPDFDDLNRHRERLYNWYMAADAPDREQEDLRDKRTKKLSPGGTGMILHGEQGTTKTTAMYWLIANIMSLNQQENVIWQSSLDDTEWKVFAPWATLCLPENVDLRMTANPYRSEYGHLGAVELEPTDLARQVIRYEDPIDLMETMAERIPGQVYVVYPDPRFRQCQSLTTWEYETMWEVDNSNEATDLTHFWFALMEALHQTDAYNDWTTIIGDEAHKWLRQGKGNDEHDWWAKIDDWATYWGDARKERLSCILSVHKWVEVHEKVRKKVRWGATMNGEDFPSEAPIGGENSRQKLGEMCVWSNAKWNYVGYPDLKRKFSVAADVSVTYPDYEAEKNAKS